MKAPVAGERWRGGLSSEFAHWNGHDSMVPPGGPFAGIEVRSSSNLVVSGNRFLDGRQNAPGIVVKSSTRASMVGNASSFPQAQTLVSMDSGTSLSQVIGNVGKVINQGTQNIVYPASWP